LPTARIFNLCYVLFCILSEGEQDMYGNFPAYNNFYHGQGPPDMGPGNMNYMVPNPRGTPPQMDPSMMGARGINDLYVLCIL